MNTLQQLGLDGTFFIELGIFIVVFVALKRIYFVPFLRLFEMRHKRTVQDREAAEKLMAQAETKLDEYKKKLADERAAARKEFDTIMDETRKHESAILGHAREESKKITQDAAESVAKQHEELRKTLEKDVEALAKLVSEKLIARKP